MKLSIDKKSWHFWLATQLGDFTPYDYGENGNICYYTRRVLKGALTLAMIVGFLSPIAVTALAGLWYLGYDVLLSHHNHANTLEQIGTVVITVVAILCCTGIAMNSLRNWLHTRQRGQRDENRVNFIVQAWRSWKQKTCVRLEFK